MAKPKKLEIIEEVENEVAEEQSVANRVFLIMGAVFIGLLFLSFALVGYPVGDIIAGKTESVLIRGNVIFLDNFRISLENSTYEQLEELYFRDRTREISICMQGHKQGDTYFITSFYQPKVYDESVAHVSFERCSQDTLIMLHTHPYRHCIASDTDINTLNKTKENNPDVVMVIMCEAKRFSVYN